MKRRDGIENLFDILKYGVIVIIFLIICRVIDGNLNHKNNLTMYISDKYCKNKYKNEILTYDNVCLSSSHAVALIFNFLQV